MTKVAALTAERLRKLLHYDPNTGIWSRLKDRGSCKAGTSIGRLRTHGYVTVNIEGIRYYAHRLAFFYMIGRWPSEMDHKDANRANNKWKNLREGNRTLNNANRSINKNRKLPKGVTQVQSGGINAEFYFARIYHNNQSHYLGCFKTPQEAAISYRAAATKLFGQFARTK